ncbi:hypothetical protein D1641_13415 [Colidextribacter sp. OB.20]|uniref:hypothetical protein n=1 Tax=Colidextribacter sp. OB.20 TaxID=2304568 RepID=UPI0013694E2A|nr:hypothetical protein [Colidextribacter sp. OB.20]NBI11000.1 hypothetical protein [Colidextribacter sp. OB.20]
MKLSYYTIDDLRLGYDPQGENGWRLSRFLDFRDALEQYCSLPDDAVKVIGISNGEQDVELARRLPVSAGTWENVLVLDFLALPLWKKEEGVISLARELASQLDIRYCLAVDKLVPAPGNWGASKQRLKGKYLWPDVPGILKSAVRWLYLSGTGWISPTELKRRYSAPEQSFHYPVITKYRVDGITADGTFAPLEVSHWEYLMLARRTQERLDHKKS